MVVVVLVVLVVEFVFFGGGFGLVFLVVFFVALSFLRFRQWMGDNGTFSRMVSMKILKMPVEPVRTTTKGPAGVYGRTVTCG